MPRRRSPELSIGWLADRLHSHMRAFYVLNRRTAGKRIRRAQGGRRKNANGSGRPRINPAADAAALVLPGAAPLRSDLRELILSSRQWVAQTVHSSLRTLC
jgi:hypothetical protein